MEETSLDVKYYINAIKDKKWYFIVPFIVVMLISATLALTLPPVYRSSGTILIESQEVPQDLIRTTVTGYIEERLQMISQVVMSRRNLVQLVEKHDPYPKAKGKLTQAEIIGLLRQDIVMTPIQAEVAGPNSRRPGTATIAFSVNYENKNPNKAYSITNELVSLYIEENLKMREEKTEVTYDFLENQLADLRSEVAELEQEIAVFKEENIESLPELMQFNLDTFNRIERDIDNKRKYIQSLIDRKIYLQGQLASIEPVKYTVTSGGARTYTIEEQLKQLRSRYMAEKASKSDTHPDVRKLKNQLESLEKEHNVQGSLREKAQELQDARARLSMLKGKYSDKHPTVIALEKEVESLDQELKDLSQRKTVLKEIEEEEPENPAYISLKTQIEQTDMEITAERESIVALQKKYEDYRRRIEQTPKVEQQFRMLQRDYQVAQQKYQETQGKLQTASEARGLEKSRAGEKLTIVDPPIRPEEPAKPNRPAIFFLGVFMAGAMGLGSGFLAEALDKRVRTPEALTSLTKAPLLASIPVLETQKMRSRRRKRRIFSVMAVLLIMVGGLMALHFFFRPLDILWISIVDRFEPLMF